MVAVVSALIFLPASDGDWHYDQLLGADRPVRAFADGALSAACAMMVTVCSAGAAVVIAERITGRRRRQLASAKAVSAADLAVALIGTAVLSGLAALATALSLA